MFVQTNAYISFARPWDLKKPEQEDELDRIIYLCAESIRICSILMQPYMPSKMKQMLDTLGVAEERRMYSDVAVGSDLDYGKPPETIGLRKGGVLFPPLSSEF